MADLSDVLPRLQHDVLTAVDRGVDTETINDEIIEPAPVSDDAKAALWLYAWSVQEPARQRHLAKQHLSYLQGATGEPFAAGD